MEEIEKYNCEGLCSHQTCNKKYTHFEIIRINGMCIMISLCEEHSIEWEDNYFQNQEKIKCEPTS